MELKILKSLYGALRFNSLLYPEFASVLRVNSFTYCDISIVRPSELDVMFLKKVNLKIINLMKKIGLYIQQYN